MPAPKKGNGPASRGGSTSGVLVRWLGGLLALFAVLAGLASFWIYQAVTLAASQAIASMLEGLSVMASLITSACAALILFSIMSVLETPLIYLPFAPFVPYLNVGLRLLAAA